MSSLSFNLLSLMAIIIIILLSLSFWMKSSKKLSTEKRNRNFITIRITVFLIGFVLAIISVERGDSASHGLKIPDLIAWIVTVIMMMVFVIAMSRGAKNKSIQKVVPYLAYNHWNYSRIGINTVTWVLYLAGYEYLLRGILLFESVDNFGVINAVAINVVIYVLIHTPKGWLETIGSIPMGFLLCALTIGSESVIPAILVHASMSVSIDFFSIMNKQQMRKLRVKS
ncbi:MAG TPA: CPBP family intramembrane glutamic endopeptidase [Cyclobacteriaceae bacterium]